MSNQHNNLSISPEEQIELLTKALLREKSARKVLENKISELSETKFEATKELLESYETARIRQIQLEFLSFLNREKIEHKDTDELIQFFVKNVLQLLGQHNSIVFQLKNDAINSIHTIDKEKSWQTLAIQDKTVSALLPLVPTKSSTWIRTKRTDNVKSNLAFLQEPLLLCLKIPQHSKVDTVIVISIEHYCYSKDFKHTLNIAANQLTEIIQKRSTNTKLISNYSQLKKTVKLLKKTQQQLVHNEKMASLGQMAAGVAHEINNPLSYLSSNLETLQDYVDQYNKILAQCLLHCDDGVINQEEIEYLNQDSKDLLAACLNGIQRVSDIVINLKQFSKKGNDDFSQIDIIMVISDSLAIVSNKLKYNYTLDISHQIKELLIDGNFGQLQQVFVNLFINAIDAMSEQGTLSISSEVIDDEVIIKVKDNGTGMTTETANKVFEPFFTTKSEEKGTGLGLSVSYAIIAKHNATIAVESVINQGTEFTLIFPALSTSV